jgi:eukaryotic-like serine/threonine-protein kinase
VKPTHATAPPARGRRIGRFLVTTLVSDGRHTTVLQARDERSGAFVSLKSAGSGIGEERLERERRLLTLLGAAGHAAPALVAETDADTEGCLAATWLQGADARIIAAELRDAADRGALADLLRAVAVAYASLHARGVLHGQVHPRHVLADGGGGVRIIDLSMGAAVTWGPQSDGVETRLSALSAPEQARAILVGERPPLTAASEQYSLAALLYILATGRSYAPLRLRRQDLPGDVVNLAPLAFAERDVKPWPELEAALGRALSKDPARRFRSVAELGDALAAAAADTGGRHRSRAPRASSGLARIAVEFRRAAADPGAIAAMPAPTCSINVGAAGVAWTLARIGELTGDDDAINDAERWLTMAEARRHDRDAFADRDASAGATIGVISPFHRESGLAVAQAQLAAAVGDAGRHQAALDDFRAATTARCDSLDATLGRSSVLIVAAVLRRRADPSWEATRRLERHGDELSAAIWQEAPTASIGCNGIAHGSAGLAYAAMAWAGVRGIAPPEQVRDVLESLAGLAEPWERGLRWPIARPGLPGSDAFSPGWCHGIAGHVFLWNLAHATYGDDVHADLAERAAHTLAGPVGVSSLCCGSAGVAYAALSRYRHTGVRRWLTLATRVAEGSVARDAVASDATSPLSLYKGHAGLALLAIELEAPERAAMPLFEADAAPPPNPGWSGGKVGTASPVAAAAVGP